MIYSPCAARYVLGAFVNFLTGTASAIIKHDVAAGFTCIYEFKFVYCRFVYLKCVLLFLLKLINYNISI